MTELANRLTTDDLEGALKLSAELEGAVYHLFGGTRLAACVLTGSTYFNGQGQDIDLVLGFMEGTASDAEFASIHELLTAGGWGYNGVPQDYGDRPFNMLTYRKGQYNLILVNRGVLNWLKAARVCKVLVMLTGRPLTKRERVAVHKVIVDEIYDPGLAILTAQKQVSEDYV